MFNIIVAIITVIVLKLAANYCDKHNIDIPDSDDHPEWREANDIWKR